LLIILFGIAEFSRAWYMRNSLKNAVRSGARLAVVTCGVTGTSGSCAGVSCPGPATVPADCNAGGTDNNDAVIAAVCCSPGVPGNTNVVIDITAQDPAGLTADDIKVSASATFTFVIGGGAWPWPPSTTIGADATMRHE
ncbi:MAG: pilus assembly protein, partial [Candidatus Sulfobium sp.]